MKVLSTLCLSAALVFGLIALVGPSPDAEAGCISCIPAGHTSTHTGVSYQSCSDADQQAISSAMAEVPSGTCFTQAIQVQACQVIYTDRALYTSKWKVRYYYPENICH